MILNAFVVCILLVFFETANSSYWNFIGPNSKYEGTRSNGYISTSVAVNADRIYVGGSFDRIGGIIGNNLAMYEYSTGSYYPLLNGTNGPITAMALNSTSGELFFAGQISLCGNQICIFIGKWNGSHYSAVGSGLSGAVTKILFDSSYRNLFAIGQFRFAGTTSLKYIGQWSGVTWLPLQSGLDNPASDFATDGINLYVGGSNLIASVNCGPSCKWNGTRWTPIWAASNGLAAVEKLAVNASNPNEIWASGNFYPYYALIGKWDGYNWYFPPSEFMAIYPPVISIMYDGSFQNVYVMNGEAPWMIARADAVDMYDMGITLDGNLHSLSWNNFTNSLIVHGDFNTVFPYTCASKIVQYFLGSNNTAPAPQLALVSNFTSMSYVPISSYSTISSIAQNISTGDIYVGTLDPGSNISLRKRNSQTNLWNSVANGPTAQITSLTYSKTTSNLYVGGLFTTCGVSINCKYIAQYNGATWSSVGGGTNGKVSALALDESNSFLYVGGIFTSVNNNTVSANRIARWDSTTWTSLGSGFSSGVVNALALNGSNLYAGGVFNYSGATLVNSIAVFEFGGISWKPLRNGVKGIVSSLLFNSFTNRLYIGGSFSNASNVDCLNICGWDGANFFKLGSGLDGAVTALAMNFTSNILYAGGSFTGVSGSPNSMFRVAKYDGSNWYALGALSPYGSGVFGLGATVSTLFLDSASSLIIGGDFSRIGDTCAWHIMKYAEISTPPTPQPTPVPWPTDAPTPAPETTTATGTTATTTATPTTSTPLTTTTTETVAIFSSSNSQANSNLGPIIGGVVGGVCLICIVFVILIVVFVLRKRKNERSVELAKNENHSESNEKKEGAATSYAKLSQSVFQNEYQGDKSIVL